MNDQYNSIEYLRKQFLCCTPLKKFKWPDFTNINDECIQKQILDLTVKNKLISKYPIKISYKTGFLKQLINKLEQSGADINDEIYTTYCDTIASKDEQLPMHYRHFLLNYEDITKILSIRESTSIISEGTTGLCSWKAAFVLAEWCLLNKQEIHGRNILELGSGVGLTGLAILNFCNPKMYHFSDCHPLVLKTLEENVRSNLANQDEQLLWKEIISNDRIELEKSEAELNRKVSIINLKWDDINEQFAEEIRADLVIAADVLYDHSNFESLAQALEKLISGTVDYCIIAATVRNESTISKFLNMLGSYDLVYEEESTTTPRVFIQTEDTPIKIFKISKLSGASARPTS